ncbi:MAG: leucyl/phenylalanyl-tRNA--protein transferase [Gammaproteobacteria bacterium]|nr:leucyl/phenylalanyl-tRNA--protein transferase [Gammaproteobacteria bacterium]
MTHFSHSSAPYWLDPHDPTAPFPPVEFALRDPDGLLALGGDLSPARLLTAYRQGIFPWYSEGQPILWWSPDPRMALRPDALKISRSLRKTLRKGAFSITLDQDFAAVMAACAEPRADALGTWITDDMYRAYQRLHALGYAHSVEAWQDGCLVGGLYGVALGKVFFGESMFTRAADASKVAFAHLVRQLHRWGFVLIDCQVYTDHLASLGAAPMQRADFCATLERHAQPQDRTGIWTLDADIGAAGW